MDFNAPCCSSRTSGGSSGCSGDLAPSRSTVVGWVQRGLGGKGGARGDSRALWDPFMLRDDGVGAHWGMTVPADASPDARAEVVPILRVRDAAATAAWYEQLGFTLTHVHRFAAELPAFATVQRGTATLFLSEHAGDARQDTLIYLRLPDAQGLAARFGLVADDNPWGPDFEVQDPDGNRLRIGTPSWW